MIKTDQTINLDDLKKIAKQFVTERDWDQFHSPKNLSMNLSIEANELMEHFLWTTPQESYDVVQNNRQEIEDEMADVFLTLLILSNVTKTDLSQAFLHKLEKIKQKYPTERFKGKTTKYNK